MSRVLPAVVMWVALALAGAAHAAPDPLGDPRLDARREELSVLVERARGAGLPSELLVDKIREGLAKGVPAPRIVDAVRALGDGLERARAELQGTAPPSPGLLRAAVEAKRGGAQPAELQLVARAGGATSAVRAMEALAELLARGYLAGDAARAVAAVATRRPLDLPQLATQAEALRHATGVSRLEALDALQRAAQAGRRLETAAELLQRGADPRGLGPPDDHGPDRETQGSRGRGGGKGPPVR